MAKLDNVQVLAANETAPLAVAKLVGNAELLVPMAGFINKEAELARLTKEIENIKMRLNVSKTNSAMKLSWLKHRNR